MYINAGAQTAGFNRMRFLIESLADLDTQFQAFGGRLFKFRGKPVDIFRQLQKCVQISAICFEQDCEPIWKIRDELVKQFCGENNILCIEEVSHTLWNPKELIEANGGIPPLTYQRFLVSLRNRSNSIL